ARRRYREERKCFCTSFFMCRLYVPNCGRPQHGFQPMGSGKRVALFVFGKRFRRTVLLFPIAGASFKRMMAIGEPFLVGFPSSSTLRVKRTYCASGDTTFP